MEQIRARLPELPEARRERFLAHYKLSRYDASLLTASKAAADLLEAALRLRPLEGEALSRRAKALANWLLGEVAHYLNRTGKEIEETPLRPEHLAGLVDLVEAGALSTTLAKTVLEETLQTGKAPEEVVRERGLVQVSDADALRSAVERAMAENGQAVADYLKGKETALRFLMGQVMRLTGGKANPQIVHSLLKERLEALRRKE